jgi:hypothetical protein
MQSCTKGLTTNIRVVDLAQPPAPLPGHANRTIALLDEAALVDEQRAVRLAAQQAVGITADLFDDRFVPPWRVADEVLERLLAAVLNHGGHRGERGRLRLRETMQVALGHRRVVVPAAAEEWAIALDEARERIRDAIDQRSGQRSSAHTVTRRIDALTSPLPVPNVLASQWFSMGSGRQAKRQDRAGPSAGGLAMVIPHPVAATVSAKFGEKHSGQRDFVKLRGRV